MENETTTQLRIKIASLESDLKLSYTEKDVAVLKTKLGNAEIALKLAHENVRQWVALSVSITAIVVTILMAILTRVTHH